VTWPHPLLPRYLVCITTCDQADIKHAEYGPESLQEASSESSTLYCLRPECHLVFKTSTVCNVHLVLYRSLLCFIGWPGSCVVPLDCVIATHGARVPHSPWPIMQRVTAWHGDALDKPRELEVASFHLMRSELYKPRESSGYILLFLLQAQLSHSNWWPSARSTTCIACRTAHHKSSVPTALAERRNSVVCDEASPQRHRPRLGAQTPPRERRLAGE
jgi:hypothetical protein